MSRYDEVRFRSTHNSYSGGPRGTILAQLGAGVRCVEFDFHDNSWAQGRDFRIGHFEPGAEVATGGGNPTTILLRDWLSVIANWSNNNATHAPITIVLDSKDDLTDNENGGSLEDLNVELESVFDAKLFTRSAFDVAGAWPETNTMAGRILCVLSGNTGGRIAYRWTGGSTPTIAANAAGDIVCIYRTAIGDLNWWSGHVGPSDTGVHWLRQHNYCPSDVGLVEPAVAVNDERWVVAVDRVAGSQFPNSLESRVGRLQDDGRIDWSEWSPQSFATGFSPSIQIVGDDVTEIHTTPSGGRQRVLGKLNRSRRKVVWQAPSATQSPAFPVDRCDVAGTPLVCRIDSTGWLGTAFGANALQAVRQRQVMFVERQKGEGKNLFRDAIFFAAAATNKADIKAARADPHVVARAWVFEDGDQTNPAVENTPATNTPNAPWYVAYMNHPSVIK